MVDKRTDINKQLRKNFFWNAAAGILNATEAVIMSVMVTRLTGLADAGMLTIAFAIGNLMMTIGKFGTRNFQVTDIEDKFPFDIYFKTRMITVILMFVSVLGYLGYAYQKLQYSRDKIGVILAVCLIYMVEATEDVFWGYYQHKNRLDVGTKMFCLRWVGILVIFPLALLMTGKLSVALDICFVVSLILFICLLKVFHTQIANPEDRNARKVKKDDLPVILQLLKTVFPLFGVSFLTFYVNNAPKYAIDACLTEELQACYGFVSMPVFVISLLNNFIYQPTLVRMAAEWDQRETEKFRRRIFRQLLIIVTISMVCLMGAYVLGIPILSILYSTDLRGFKKELLILLVAGEFLAMSGYLGVILTIMRCQRDLLRVYCFIAVIALVSLKRIVSRFRTMGAAVAYMILMILLCSMYGSVLIIRMRNEKRKKESGENS